MTSFYGSLALKVANKFQKKIASASKFRISWTHQHSESLETPNWHNNQTCPFRTDFSEETATRDYYPLEGSEHHLGCLKSGHLEKWYDPVGRKKRSGREDLQKGQKCGLLNLSRMYSLTFNSLTCIGLSFLLFWKWLKADLSFLKINSQLCLRKGM